MPHNLHLFTNQNALSTVGRKAGTENAASEAPLRITAARVVERIERPSARLRHVRGLIEDLLLEDDFEHENGLLMSSVEYDLNRIVVELDQIAGSQHMFELWIQEVP
jgi:hypothetical protein